MQQLPEKTKVPYWPNFNSIVNLALWGIIFILCYIGMGVVFGGALKDHYYSNSIADVTTFHEILSNRIDRCSADTWCADKILVHNHSFLSEYKYLKELTVKKLSSTNKEESKDAAWDYTNFIADNWYSIKRLFDYFDENLPYTVSEVKPKDLCKMSTGQWFCYEIVFPQELLQQGFAKNGLNMKQNIIDNENGGNNHNINPETEDFVAK